MYFDEKMFYNRSRPYLFLILDYDNNILNKYAESFICFNELSLVYVEYCVSVYSRQEFVRDGFLFLF